MGANSRANMGVLSVSADRAVELRHYPACRERNQGGPRSAHPGLGPRCGLARVRGDSMRPALRAGRPAAGAVRRPVAARRRGPGPPRRRHPRGQARRGAAYDRAGARRAGGCSATTPPWASTRGTAGRSPTRDVRGGRPGPGLAAAGPPAVARARHPLWRDWRRPSSSRPTPPELPIAARSPSRPSEGAPVRRRPGVRPARRRQDGDRSRPSRWRAATTCRWPTPRAWPGSARRSPRTRR